MTISVAEEANAFSAGNNRAYSNGESGEDKCGSGTEIRYRCSTQKGLLCDENRPGKELLYLWGFGHMAHHCRNRERGRMMEERRVEYGGGRIEKINKHSNNLKGVENLEFLD